MQLVFQDLNHVVKSQVLNPKFLWNLKSSKSKSEIKSPIFNNNTVSNFNDVNI